MKKRIFILLLTMSILLSACTSNSQTPSASPQDTSAAQPNNSEAATSESLPSGQESAQEPSGGTAYPLTGENLKLTYWSSFSVGDYIDSYNSSFIMPAIQEATGVDFNVMEVSRTIAAEQYGLMIASGSYPDTMGVSDYYTGGIAQAFKDEVIIDLTDLLPENAPDYWSYVQELDQGSLDALLTEGRHLSFSSISDGATATSIGRGNITRKDWLDKLNLSVPETLDEFTNMLYAIKTEYDTDYTYFIEPDGVVKYVYAAFNTQIIDLRNAVDLGYFINDGKVVSAYASDGYREYLEWFRGLFSDGLIDPDFFTDSRDYTGTMTSIGSGRAGVWENGVDGMDEVMDYSTDPDFETVAIPVIVKEKGAENTWVETSARASSGEFCVTDACKNPELALQFWNYFFTADGIILANYGVEGVSFNYKPDGSVEYTNMIVSNPDMDLRISSDIYLPSKVPVYSISEKFYVTYTEKQKQTIATWSPVGTDKHTYPAGASLTADEAEQISQKVADCITFAEENLMGFLTCSIDLSDASWQSYVDTLVSIGINECLSIYQNAYDEYLRGERNNVADAPVKSNGPPPPPQ